MWQTQIGGFFRFSLLTARAASEVTCSLTYEFGSGEGERSQPGGRTSSRKGSDTPVKYSEDGADKERGEGGGSCPEELEMPGKTPGWKVSAYE